MLRLRSERRYEKGKVKRRRRFCLDWGKIHHSLEAGGREGGRRRNEGVMERRKRKGRKNVEALYNMTSFYYSQSLNRKINV